MHEVRRENGFLLASSQPSRTTICAHSSAQSAITPISTSLKTKHLRGGCWSSGAVRLQLGPHAL